MILAGTDKDLIAAVHSQSDNSQVASGVMLAVIRLESDDSDDGKLWDTVSGLWITVPTDYPTALYIGAGLWGVTISGIATAGKANDKIHYTFTDNTNNLFATTICQGAEYYIREEIPVGTSDVVLYEMKFS